MYQDPYDIEVKRFLQILLYTFRLSGEIKTRLEYQENSFNQKLVLAWQ